MDNYKKDAVHLLNKHCDMMKEMLEGTGDYKVLKRINKNHKLVKNNDKNSKTKKGLILDLETTGLDFSKDEILEIGLIAFDYNIDGTIINVTDTYTQLREPKHPITDDITKLTGINHDMVLGKSIDDSIVNRFATDSDIVIAHNADFDRKFAERNWNIFSSKAWACSQTGINWNSVGLNSMKLSNILYHFGLFHDGHRALEDCWAVLEILNKIIDSSGKTIFGLLLENARTVKNRIYSVGSSFNKNQILKARGYNWNDGSDGQPKAWYCDVDQNEIKDELLFLKHTIFDDQNVDLPIRKTTAYNRYSNRIY